MARDRITDQEWQRYEEDGFLALGKILSDDELGALQARIDAIMLGRAEIDYNGLMMQLDSATGKYNDAGEQSNGFKGATLAYRKIQNLELDDLFLRYMSLPIFRDICSRSYGPGTPISSFRAMFMNKPSNQGTKLPWHQDAWTDLDRQPLVTLWTALDPATKANGCVEVIPGSHKMGLVNPSHNSGFLSDEQVEKLCRPELVQYLEAEPGEALLLHNWLLHSSDVNRTPVSRRAFSVCYMDAATVAHSGAKFPRVFEPVAV